MADHTRDARDYLRGRRSQADVARELGLSVRQLQRIEDEAVARWLLGIARALREAIGEPPLTMNEACRISPTLADDLQHAEHGAGFSAPSTSSSAVDARRARHLPRRWRRP